MKIAILLPVYNHLDYTIQSLMKLNEVKNIYNKEISIVVIDDGSTDGTYEIVKSKFENVDILKGDGNLWWSGAINLGAKYAIETLKSDYLILWNNDITYDINYFHKLIKYLNNSDSNTIIGSKVLVRENPELIWSMGGCFNPMNGEYYMYGYFKKDSIEFNQITHVDWLTGMGTIIPKIVVEKIGYWDSINFPQYHGDSDFTYRAKLKGFKIIVNPELVIYNNVKNSGIEHHGSIKQLIKLMTDLRSKANFYKKYKFYKIHSKSIFAYYPLFLSYFKIFGGFFKWKLLQLISIKKNEILTK